jgi:hypothetical protein
VANRPWHTGTSGAVVVVWHHAAMARKPLPALAAVVSFIDAINRGDLDGFAKLMQRGHRLVVLGEQPVVGRAANVEAWNGYLASFPNYVIYPRYMTAAGIRVAVLGTTTGSHLGLADDEEMRFDVIWLAEVAEGALSLWQIAEDTPATRAEAGIPAIV